MFGDGREAFGPVGAFHDPAPAAFERGDGLARVAFDRGQNGVLGRRIILAHDLVELGGLHARALQLGEGGSGANRAELLHVADQDHSGAGLAGVVEQRCHVAGGKQRSFVHDPHSTALQARLTHKVLGDSLALHVQRIAKRSRRRCGGGERR